MDSEPGMTRREMVGWMAAAAMGGAIEKVARAASHLRTEWTRASPMKLEEYVRYDAVGLAELVRRREVSARELAETALAAIALVNPRINAVVETFPERAAT